MTQTPSRVLELQVNRAKLLAVHWFAEAKRMRENDRYYPHGKILALEACAEELSAILAAPPVVEPGEGNT